MIEDNWGLEPLSIRDATAGNIADELDYSHPRNDPPRIDVAAGPFGVPCPSETPGTGLAQLRALAVQYGFPVR
jgi:hypothetical protein